MPLLVQFRRAGRWETLGVLEAGMRDGSLAHYAPHGRETYLFGCRGDHSLVRRSRAGADVERGLERVVVAVDGFEEVARLTVDEPDCEFWVRTERSPEPIRVRFRHEPF